MGYDGMKRRFDGLAYLCDEAGRTSPRAGRRAGPLRVPSTQAGTVAEGANEKVHLASVKRPRSAESPRISSPAITCIWVSYINLYVHRWGGVTKCAGVLGTLAEIRESGSPCVLFGCWGKFPAQEYMLPSSTRHTHYSIHLPGTLQQRCLIRLHDDMSSTVYQ